MSANTAIKYAAGVGGDDLSYIARDLHCDPDFIRAQRKTNSHAVFACFVRNLMKNPASVSVPWQPLAREPQMTDAQHRKLIERNRALFSTQTAPEKRTTSEGSTLVSDYILTYENQKQKPPLEAASHPAVDATGGSPTGISPEADKPILPQSNPDPSKPTKWKRGADH